MTAAFGILLVVVIALLIGTGFVLWHVARSPLTRRTVERFAARQHLTMTSENSAHVVAALLITHRWRRVGLVLGLLIGMVWSLRDGSLTLNFLAGFLGWFAGAVIAQWRISGLDAPGTRRAAMLAPRRVSGYVTPLVLGLLALTGLTLAATAIAAAARAGLTGQWYAWVAYALGLGIVLALSVRTIINRPSGFVDAGIREADDALRCHGLTTLAGTAIAASYPALWSFAVLAVHPHGVPYSVDPAWTFLIMVGCLALGFYVAVRSPSIRPRSSSEPPAPAPEQQAAADEEHEPA